ncbi:MAG: MFS transporter [Aquabacterium sp.]|nr:MFS transporter [Aquabacterium sp.]
MHDDRAGKARRIWGLAPDDLFHNAVYRRLWASILMSSVGAQVTLLALPLTAALLLDATPLQMGLLTAVETLPFALFSLPAGVWLDRVRKLPVYVVGELTIALAVLTVPLAWWLGWLRMGWLYAVGFIIGSVSVLAGSAAQIVLTQVVPRERLVEAHARNALASSGAEVAGPGLAGVLVKALGAPLALLVDAVMLLLSAVILRGVRVQETLAQRGNGRSFGPELRVGLQFVRRHRLLVALALAVGGWQACHNAALVVQILHATRGLGLDEQTIGLCYAGLGVGTISASLFGNRLSDRIGPGPSMQVGFVLCATGWLLPWLWPTGTAGVAAFAAMLLLSGTGGVLIFINFLGMRQAVTPAPLLGRMTATMRWLILLPAIPGALLGGWIGEHAGLVQTLGAAGLGAAVLALLVWRGGVILAVRVLPSAVGDVPAGPAEHGPPVAQG